MNESLALIPFAKVLLRDFRQAGRKLLVFDALFQALRAWLIAPLIALTLSFILLQADYVAVSNQDLIGFLLTPLGGLYAAFLSTAAAALFLLEQAGLLAVAATVLLNRPHVRPAARQSLRIVLASILRIARLGFAKIVWLLLAISPFAALTLLTYFALLTRYDLYFYWNDRPPEFWLAAGIGSVLLLLAAVLGAYLLVHWSLALPIALFETQPAFAALAASRQRVRGAAWPIARLLLGWLLGMLALGMIAAGGFRILVVTVLSQFGHDSLPVFGGLLALQAALLMAHSFVSAAGLALIMHRLYWLRGPQTDSRADHLLVREQPELAPVPVWLRAASWLAIVVVVASPLTMWGVFVEKVTQRSKVLVTAHRGFAKRAPENTLIALQKAIDIGADYAEIDVHQTRDGVVVLLHDRDLRRVAGDSRRLDQLTFAEARQLDVGSWFSPEFADQRLPTLEEAIQLCRGKIRLNIELKIFGPADGLAQAVARIVQQQGLEAECIVTSLSNEALVAARRHHPKLLVGIIVGHSIGNLNRLEVDALSVRAEHLSTDMIRTAQRQGRQVMVWGMSGKQQMTQQLRRGVDNLITSDPDIALQLRDRWREISDHERLVIACRLLLGIGERAR